MFDLETVPDLAAAGRMLDLANVGDAEIRQARFSSIQDRLHRGLGTWRTRAINRVEYINQPGSFSSFR